MLYTGFARRNALFLFVWLRPRNTRIPIQHVGRYYIRWPLSFYSFAPTQSTASPAADALEQFGYENAASIYLGAQGTFNNSPFLSTALPRRKAQRRRRRASAWRAGCARSLLAKRRRATSGWRKRPRPR